MKVLIIFLIFLVSCEPRQPRKWEHNDVVNPINISCYSGKDLVFEGSFNSANLVVKDGAIGFDDYDALITNASGRKKYKRYIIKSDCIIEEAGNSYWAPKPEYR